MNRHSTHEMNPTRTSNMRRRSVAGIMGITTALLASAGFAVADGVLQPRAAAIKPAKTIVEVWQDPASIYVKFAELPAGQAIRLRNGAMSDLGTGALARDRRALSAVPGTWSRMHMVDEGLLAQWNTQAKANLGKDLADLNLEYRLHVPAGANTAAICDQLNALAIVEIAMPFAKAGVNANVMAPPSAHGAYQAQAPLLPADMPPPNLQPFQFYLNVAVGGIGASKAWPWPGGTGAGVKVCDVEYDWNELHTDLPTVSMAGPPPLNPNPGDDDHGTAVLGAMVSKNDSVGTTGACYGAKAYFAAVNTASGGYNLAAAITNALGQLQAGDVILIEQQLVGPKGGQLFVPVEWFLPYYNSIQTAVGLGVVVVEAAGNGYQNLDEQTYQQGNGGHYPFLPQNDSGAIIVGAGVPPDSFDKDRARLDFSNYGGTLDLQGYGTDVVTTGYGDAYSAQGKNYHYTYDFGGTSSASPIVAAAAVQLQAVHKAVKGSILTPKQIRDTLVATGSAQQNGFFPASQKIGPRPNVVGAAFLLIDPNDCNTNNTPDLIDIQMGISKDTNKNGVPDECEQTCAADCDSNFILNVNDFICFQTLYAIGHPEGDCDKNGQLNIEDFICYQTLYAVGC